MPTPRTSYYEAKDGRTLVLYHYTEITIAECATCGYVVAKCTCTDDTDCPPLQPCECSN